MGGGGEGWGGVFQKGLSYDGFGFCSCSMVYISRVKTNALENVFIVVKNK